MSKLRALTELCGLRVPVESYVAPNGPLQCKRCQRFGQTQRNCGYAPRCVACGGSHLSGGCVAPREQPKCCGCGGDHTAKYRGCVKWKEAKAALAKRAPEQGPKSIITGHPVASKAQRARPSAEQTDLGEGWSHVVQGSVSSGLKPIHIHPQFPNPKRSRRRPSSLKRSPPVRRQGLRIPCPKL